MVLYPSLHRKRPLSITYGNGSIFHYHHQLVSDDSEHFLILCLNVFENGLMDPLFGGPRANVATGHHTY